ncbi:MAG TPA: hypothetical protein VGX23_15170 [Actinocrinis sp.]|nr:hypothetical protein [Actinocrinis sp.]
MNQTLLTRADTDVAAITPAATTIPWVRTPLPATARTTPAEIADRHIATGTVTP